MWSTNLMSLLFVVVLCFNQSEGARILAYFPVPSISHQVVFRPITQELAKRGHELLIITTDPAFEKGKAPYNMTEIDIHDISYEVWHDTLKKYINGRGYAPAYTLRVFMTAMVGIVDNQLNVEEVKKLIEDTEHFDLILAEACVRSPLVFSYIFKAPVIQISSFASFKPNKQVIGAPSHPIFYPDIIYNRIQNLSVMEKFERIYVDFQLQAVGNYIDAKENQMLKHIFGSSIPSLSEMENDVDLLMLNINPLWEGNHAYPPNVVSLGGLHQKPEKPLPKDLKQYLDSSKNGVIYMSFGTNVHPSLLPSEKIHIFNKVFSKLPYDVLWKWDKETMAGKSDNVKISKWLPQSDLLRHPKIKLFITQAGLQSTDESITAGVPLLAFPMLGDQWYNAEKYEYHKIGLRMDFETLTEENLEAYIKKVIEDESYRKNIVRLRTLMNDQPQTPLERAVWWTEYVIRHKGAKHLKSPMANISWAEYLVLDVLLLVLGVGLVILLIGSYVLYKIVKSVLSFGSQKSKLKNN